MPKKNTSTTNDIVRKLTVFEIRCLQKQVKVLKRRRLKAENDLQSNYKSLQRRVIFILDLKKNLGYAKIF